MNHVQTEILADPWYDLVYHVLSLIPVRQDDASRLISSAYVEWADSQFRKHGIASGNVERTVTEDAGTIASLYAENGKGHMLHSFPLLWDSASDFRQVMGEDFSQIGWNNDRRRMLAETLCAGLNPALIELFRTALWAELENGYLEMREKSIGEQVNSYTSVFAEILSRVSVQLPKLQQYKWVLCHPLRKHGRLLSSANPAAVMVVGVADPVFDVSKAYPVYQGCHEHFVSVASAESREHREFSTQKRREGHDHFSKIETRALSLGARFFVDSPWRTEYLEWLSFLYPDDPEGAAAELIAST